MIKETSVRTAFSMLVVVTILLMIGCAAKVAPIEDISNAQMAVKEAEESNAATYAPLELKFATDKLAKARTALQAENYEEALQLANEALLDAKLAEAKSRSEEAKKTTQELRNTIETLRQEIERSEQRGK
jgi:Domain of unknown function (DUF4398)